MMISKNDPVIRIEKLTKVFKGELGQKSSKALDELNLSVYPGEVFAFLGPNGAGKTTTVKCLTRLISPTSGKISILGRETLKVDDMHYIGYLPEQPRFYEYLTGEELLDLTGRLFGMDRALRMRRIPELIDRTGLSGKADIAIRHFSRGMMQRLGLAQAIINEPELLILDEPMASLDPMGRKDFRDLILELKAEGKTLFFSSHILSDAEMIADRFAIINQGRLVRIGKLDELIHKSVAQVEITFHITPEQRKRFKWETEPVILDDRLMITVQGEAEADTWIKKIISAKGRIFSVVPRRYNLESLFMDEMGRRS